MGCWYLLSGIDTMNELWLFPIARDAVLAELPPGWVEKLDASGDPYYVDLSTNVRRAPLFRFLIAHLGGILAGTDA
jgi:hypothetical protein